jgi:two-component system, NarL family, response regulator NreC
MITILLVDDHHLVRQGFRSLLESEGDMHVVGDAGDGLQALELVERLHPNLVVADVMMPGMNGLELTRQLHQAAPQTRVILLSMHANEAYVMEALRNGASGYILKDGYAVDLIQAIRKVAAGGRYLSAPLSERAIEAYAQMAQDASFDTYETLTNRERLILQLAAEGYSGTEIAQKLTISARTVETHRGNLMHKLGLHSQTDLVRYAMKRGIVST